MTLGRTQGMKGQGSEEMLLWRFGMTSLGLWVPLNPGGMLHDMRGRCSPVTQVFLSLVLCLEGLKMNQATRVVSRAYP